MLASREEGNCATLCPSAGGGAGAARIGWGLCVARGERHASVVDRGMGMGDLFDWRLGGAPLGDGLDDEHLEVSCAVVSTHRPLGARPVPDVSGISSSPDASSASSCGQRVISNETVNQAVVQTVSVSMLSGAPSQRL